MNKENPNHEKPEAEKGGVKGFDFSRPVSERTRNFLDDIINIENLIKKLEEKIGPLSEEKKAFLIGNETPFNTIIKLRGELNRIERIEELLKKFPNLDEEIQNLKNGDCWAALVSLDDIEKREQLILGFGVLSEKQIKDLRELPSIQAKSLLKYLSNNDLSPYTKEELLSMNISVLETLIEKIERRDQILGLLFPSTDYTNGYFLKEKDIDSVLETLNPYMEGYIQNKNLGFTQEYFAKSLGMTQEEFAKEMISSHKLRQRQIS